MRDEFKKLGVPFVMLGNSLAQDDQRVMQVAGDELTAWHRAQGIQCLSSGHAT